MEVFDIVFNRSSIYDTLFFNIQAVTQYRDYKEMEEANPQMASEWRKIASSKYKTNLASDDTILESYGSRAVLYPEFTKIVAITYATVEFKGGELTRHIRKIVDENEYEIVRKFRNYLLQRSSDAIQSKPPLFPTLCGYNIINNDLPLLMKRMMFHRKKIHGETESDLIPLILKKYLRDKPWDSNIVDLHNLWRFNGMVPLPLSSINYFLDLKTNVNDILPPNEISSHYWGMILNGSDSKEAMEEIALQSANVTNLSIQIFNELRQM